MHCTWLHYSQQRQAFGPPNDVVRFDYIVTGLHATVRRDYEEGRVLSTHRAACQLHTHPPPSVQRGVRADVCVVFSRVCFVSHGRKVMRVQPAAKCAGVTAGTLTRKPNLQGLT